MALVCGQLAEWHRVRSASALQTWRPSNRLFREREDLPDDELIAQALALVGAEDLAVVRIALGLDPTPTPDAEGEVADDSPLPTISTAQRRTPTG